jgi:hypothetical protein
MTIDVAFVLLEAELIAIGRPSAAFLSPPASDGALEQIQEQLQITFSDDLKFLAEVSFTWRPRNSRTFVTVRNGAASPMGNPQIPEGFRTVTKTGRLPKPRIQVQFLVGAPPADGRESEYGN